MLELLEELLPNFKQEFNRRVTMQELTRLSIQLSPKTAIVISNQWMYVIQKKWLSLKCKSFNPHEIGVVDYRDGKLIIELSNGRREILNVADEKIGVITFGLEKINEHLAGARRSR